VFSCYRPVESDRPIPSGQKRLSTDDWAKLVYLAHADKREGFRQYSTYYLSTSGQVYWSDTHQMSTYLEDYHPTLDRKLGTPPATEMITEINVPRARLADFLAEAREDFRKNRVNLIYGTIRLIEKDDESFLTWARESWACTIFNLHTEHSPAGLRTAAASFRRLIDMAARRGGTYYLTYHRWADRAQIETCYPRFREFLRLKRHYDPDARFQSDWWRHHARMFGMA
jgi:FAD/FMN-containing dehydrogenase